mgnify:CR=1 FL=1
MTYKDGGVVVTDGARARRWFARYRTLARAFGGDAPGGLMQFMHEQQVDYALVPDTATHS